MVAVPVFCILFRKTFGLLGTYKDCSKTYGTIWEVTHIQISPRSKRSFRHSKSRCALEFEVLWASSQRCASLKRKDSTTPNMGTPNLFRPPRTCLTVQSFSYALTFFACRSTPSFVCLTWMHRLHDFEYGNAQLISFFSYVYPFNFFVCSSFWW